VVGTTRHELPVERQFDRLTATYLDKLDTPHFDRLPSIYLAADRRALGIAMQESPTKINY
jgi:hypothetical protein